MRIRLKSRLEPVFRRFKGWVLKIKERRPLTKSNLRRVGKSVRRVGYAFAQKMPRKWKDIKFDRSNLNLAKVAEQAKLIRWALIVIALFLLSEVVSKLIGVFLRPVYTKIPKKPATQVTELITSQEDHETILRRNMFNVEGKIPDPFDQGLLDCLSQAKKVEPGKIFLVGTVVMSDEKFSTALIQEDGKQDKYAIKQDESFGDGKYVALKIDRLRLCYQVRATQDLEFIELSYKTLNLGGGTTLQAKMPTEGINPVAEGNYVIKRRFLDEKLKNLNEVLQSAKAIPYVENGRFKGFLIQTIDPGSIFSQLGLYPGDLLQGVNDIPLDSPGKGLEAYQKLQNSPKVVLQVSRGGENKTIYYEVK